MRFLPKGETVHGVADRCRAAGVAFARGTTGGWGPRELAAWLVDHYEPATSATRTIIAARRRPPPSTYRALDAATLERVVLDARTRIFEMLARSATTWEGDSFAQMMVDGMLIVGVTDTGGSIGYAPVRYAEMRLVDRVASLFVADYLTRPGDYVTLATCEECGDLAFDGEARHESWCAEPPSRSDIVPAIEVPSHDTEPGLCANFDDD